MRPRPPPLFVGLLCSGSLAFSAEPTPPASPATDSLPKESTPWVAPEEPRPFWLLKPLPATGPTSRPGGTPPAPAAPTTTSPAASRVHENLLTLIRADHPWSVSGVSAPSLHLAVPGEPVRMASFVVQDRHEHILRDVDAALDQEVRLGPNALFSFKLPNGLRLDVLPRFNATIDGPAPRLNLLRISW